MTIKEIKSNLLTTFDKLEFYEKHHIYKVDGKRLESTSKKIGSFYEKFPANRMSAYVAKKWNKENPNGPKKTKFDILREWKEKANTACERGTRVHNFAELFPNFREPICDQERGVIEWFNDLPPHINLVMSELMMYSDTYNYSGTADKILLNEKTGNLIISDWKTNEDILKNYKRKMMKAPFGNMLDHALNHYKIQLNHYKLLIESMTSFKVEDMWVVWLKEQDDGKLYKEFFVKDMTQKLKNHYGKLQNNTRTYV